MMQPGTPWPADKTDSAGHEGRGSDRRQVVACEIIYIM
jgi:hypothetical protein